MMKCKSVIQRNRLALLAFAAWCALGASRAAAVVDELCFYVERPATIMVGEEEVRVGPGHLFLELHDLKGDLGGARYVRGLYPGKMNIITGAGEVKDDAARTWHYKICFPIAWAKWNAVAAGINADQVAPPGYNLLTFNCGDWVTQKAGLAGIALPVINNRLNIADPDTFWASLDTIGDTGTFGTGTVTENPNPRSRLSSNPAGSLCHDFGFEQLETWGHLDPAGLSGVLALELNLETLGTITVQQGETLQVNVTGTTAASALISMSWGDGSPFDAQDVGFSHQYGTTNTYEATLLVINEGAINHYAVSVQVLADTTTGTLNASVPASTPSTVSNLGCPDGESVAMGNVPTVSEWGLVVITLLLMTAGTVVFGRPRRPAAA